MDQEQSRKSEEFETQVLALESYIQVLSRLQHFNKMQTTYRTYAFTWLLATFIGIGYTLSPKEANLPVDRFLVVMLLCIASSAGIFLIWYMDLMVCETMIATALYQGLECEKEHEWLPKINQSSKLFHSLWGYVHLKAIFYICFFIIIYGTFGAALGLYLKHTSFWFLAPIIALIALTSISCVLVFSTKNADPYLRLSKLKKEEKWKDLK